MRQPCLSIIVAMSPQRVIGLDGQLPWRIPADLRRFKQLTMGHHLIMGRKTFDSIGRLLPGRRTVVVSRQSGLVIPGACVVHSIADALCATREDTEVFFVGGEQIYLQALPLADRVYLTVVRADVSGDTHFPVMQPGHWRLVGEEFHGADDRNAFDHVFQLWERVRL